MKKKSKTHNGWRAHPVNGWRANPQVLSDIDLELKQLELLTRIVAERKLTKAQLHALN